MARKALDWVYEDLYGGLFHDGTLTRWSAKQSIEFPNSALHGVTLWVAQADFDPERAWLTKPPLVVGQSAEEPAEPDSPAVE